RISQIIPTFTLPATAFDGIKAAPYASTPNPTAIIINPNPYFTAADGLYLLSHHFVNSEANAIMKNEFRMLNQLTVISTSFSFTSVTRPEIICDGCPAF